MSDGTSSSGLPNVPGYENLRLLGRGGFATVYQAREIAFNREVAIKVLDVADLEADAFRRFERECMALGSLSSHPNIVTVFGAGSTAEGRPYLVMELMEGGSLGQWLKETGPIAAAEVIRHGRLLLGAIGHAHDLGIVHRDIKPDNVLVSRYGTPQLADFGISSFPGGYETQSGMFTATIGYAAPEVINGDPATVATDCYSMAATLASLLIGQPVFARRTSEHITALMNRVFTEAPPDLTAYGASPELNAVLQRGLSKDPAQRFPSAREFGAALAAVGDVGEVVAAAPAVAAPQDLTTVRREVVPRAVPAAVPAAAVEPAESVVPAAAAPKSARGKRRVVVGVLVAALLSAGGAAWAMTRDPAAGPTTPDPIAAPTFTAACTGLTCDLATAAAGSLRWDFGDGKHQAADGSIRHVFARPGKYAVSVTAAQGNQSVRSAPVVVEIGSVRRKLKVTAGAAGTMAITADLTSTCGASPYRLDRKAGGAWKTVKKGRLIDGSTGMRVASTGSYRVVLAAKGIKDAVCVPITSKGVTVRPKPVTAPPPSSSGSSNGGGTTPRPSKPKPSKPKPYLPPKL